MKEPMPMRMSETNELPPALRDAFGKLGSEAPSAETVLRIQRALEALPAAAPTAAAVGALGASKLLVVVTLLAGAATSAVVWKSRDGDRPVAEQASISVPSPVHSTAPSDAPVATAAPNAEQANQQQALNLEPAASEGAVSAPTTPTTEPAEPVATDASARAERTERVADPRNAPRAKRSTAAKQPNAELSAQWARSLIAPSAATAARAGAVRGPESVAEAPAAAQPSSSAAEPSVQAPSQPTPSLAAAQASEAQRLAQCKRLAAQSPEEALRLLEALAREIPHGVFVQERELLEIRLHERLGHRDTAAALTQQFLQRHPGSVYRRALTP